MTLLFFYLFLAIFVSFLCSILEAVLLSVNSSFIESKKISHPKRSEALVKAKTNIDESLSSILILNTFAHTFGAAGVGSQAVQIFGEKWEGLIAFFLTLAILYFSEIIPKTLGATFWRSLAFPAAKIINILVIVTYPFVWLSSRITVLFSKNKENQISRDEIMALARLGGQTGALDKQENELLHNLMKLRTTKTEDILTPRSVMFSLDIDTPFNEALAQANEHHFSRIPVYKDSIDKVEGLVLHKTLLSTPSESTDSQGTGPTLAELMNPIMHVSANLPVSVLLERFLRQNEHIAVVDDEFGQTEGIVSLEDALETLLGREIVDEHDKVEDMQELAKQRYRERLRKSDQ